MIAGKLLLHRHRTRRHSFTPSDGHRGDIYISAIGVLAESAALYTISTLTYVILDAYENPARTWWMGVMMSMSVSSLPNFLEKHDIYSKYKFLSQALIILRITMGSAYNRPTTPMRSSGLRGPVFARNTQQSTAIESTSDEIINSDPIITESVASNRVTSVV
jgi:hypothetical protein